MIIINVIFAITIPEVIFAKTDKSTQKALNAYEKFLSEQKEPLYFQIVDIDKDKIPILLITTYREEKSNTSVHCNIYKYTQKSVKKISSASCTSTAYYLALRDGYLTYASHHYKGMLKINGINTYGYYYLEQFKNGKNITKACYRYTIKNDKLTNRTKISEKISNTYILNSKHETPVIFRKNTQINRNKYLK